MKRMKPPKDYFFVVAMEDDRDCVGIHVVKAYTSTLAYRKLVDKLGMELNKDEDEPTFDPEDVYMIEYCKPVRW